MPDIYNLRQPSLVSVSTASLIDLSCAVHHEAESSPISGCEALSPTISYNKPSAAIPVDTIIVGAVHLNPFI